MLNEFYLKEDTLKELKDVFESDSSVVMQDAITQTIDLPESILEQDPLHARWERADFEFTVLNDYFAKFGITDLKFEVIRLGWKDYEILTDDAAYCGAEVLIDLTDSWDSSWGGEVRYTDGDENLLMIPIKKNMICITKLGALHRYITYCNHHCNGHKRVLLVGRGKVK